MEQVRALASKLITEHCTSLYLDKFDFFSDIECLKLTASKGLGLGIVAGSAIMKVPQIINILPGDTTGLSMPRFVIESVTFTTIAAYNIRHGYSFSTWGENLFLLLQNYVIILLLLYHRGQFGVVALLWIALYVGATWAFISGFLESLPLTAIDIRQGESVLFSRVLAGPGALHTVLQLCTIVMAPVSRVLQIYKSWSEGRTGQLSLPTQFLAAAGSVVRALTIFKEVDNMVLLLAGVLSAILNNIVFGQIIYYNYCVRKKKKVD